MAKYTSKGMGFSMDGAAATLVALSGQTNQVSIDHSNTLLDDTGLGDNDHTMLYGLGQNATLSANGWMDSTVRAILAPLATAVTSRLYTMEMKLATLVFLNGEFLIDSVQISGDVDAIQTWSIGATCQSTLNSTTKALS